MQNNKKAPSPIMRPPLIFLVFFLAGTAVHFLLLPLPMFSSAPAAMIIGILFLATGIVALVWALRTLSKAKVNPRFKPVDSLVLTGPFALSRNPIYASFILVYSGIAFLLNSFWPLILLPPLLAILHYGVIMREEKYLEEKFGNEYRRYQNKVRRWL